MDYLDDIMLDALGPWIPAYDSGLEEMEFRQYDENAWGSENEV